MTEPRRRRRRTDATRSVEAILGSAKQVLAERPNANMEDVAAAANLSRQTVYAHFRTRELLISAVVDAIAADAAAAMDAARLDEGPAAQALLRLLDVSWRTTQPYSALLATVTPLPDQDADRVRHQPVTVHLERILDRGQRCGEFTNDQPVSWLAAAVVAIGHTAGGAVHSGHMTRADAAKALANSVLWLCGATSGAPSP
ncbi:hypothetical protein BLA60_35140 [Actinophytocola xinjiangensis]|uniref:HTH tetR-type domain-containing protein n=1 Tax=Actinophytocola xinjiangensis TaxID=485602 RepID=A0A7Z0WF09_9PSEU|nr:hypothetical protein BLA60_35140 [Actinophytocola xinjiangensis]